MTSIQDQLKGLQKSQQMMRLVVEGLATEKLIKEVQHAAAQSATEVSVIQVELGDLHSKIAAPVE